MHIIFQIMTNFQNRGVSKQLAQSLYCSLKIYLLEGWHSVSACCFWLWSAEIKTALRRGICWPFTLPNMTQRNITSMPSSYCHCHAYKLRTRRIKRAGFGIYRNKALFSCCINPAFEISNIGDQLIVRFPDHRRQYCIWPASRASICVAI